MRSRNLPQKFPWNDKIMHIEFIIKCCGETSWAGGPWIRTNTITTGMKCVYQFFFSPSTTTTNWRSLLERVQTSLWPFKCYALHLRIDTRSGRSVKASGWAMFFFIATSCARGGALNELLIREFYGKLIWLRPKALEMQLKLSYNCGLA